MKKKSNKKIRFVDASFEEIMSPMLGRDMKRDL